MNITWKVGRCILGGLSIVLLTIIGLMMTGYSKEQNEHTTIIETPTSNYVDCEAAVRYFNNNSDFDTLKSCVNMVEWGEAQSLGGENSSAIKYLVSDPSVALISIDDSDTRRVAAWDQFYFYHINHTQSGYLIRGYYSMTEPMPTATEQLVVVTPASFEPTHVVEYTTPDNRSFNERNGLVEAVNTRYYSTECRIYRLAGGPSYYDAEKYGIVPDTIGLEYSSSQSDYCIYPIILVRK